VADGSAFGHGDKESHRNPQVTNKILPAGTAGYEKVPFGFMPHGPFVKDAAEHEQDFAWHGKDGDAPFPDLAAPERPNSPDARGVSGFTIITAEAEFDSSAFHQEDEVSTPPLVSSSSILSSSTTSVSNTNPTVRDAPEHRRLRGFGGRD
jgi:hypothetical protein